MRVHCALCLAMGPKANIQFWHTTSIKTNNSRLFVYASFACFHSHHPFSFPVSATHIFHFLTMMLRCLGCTRYTQTHKYTRRVSERKCSCYAQAKKGEKIFFSYFLSCSHSVASSFVCFAGSYIVALLKHIHIHIHP